MKTPLNKTTILGIGWMDTQVCGCVNLRQRSPYDAQAGRLPPWQDTELLGGPLKNIGRMDSISRVTCGVCALAFRDAGLTREAYRNLNIGLVGANENGSLDANRAYFSDYLEGGRKLGRGNLFVYTLPTSSLAEASIHFGLKACLLYVATPANRLADFLKTAEGLIIDGQAEYLMACHLTGTEAIAFLLGPASHTHPQALLELDDICALTNGSHPMAELILKIEERAGRNKRL